MHHGFKLDMYTFVSKDPYPWVFQMKKFLIIHNIQDNNWQLHVALLYLDSERLRQWQWNKKCVRGWLDWNVISKSIYACFDHETKFLARLTKFHEIGMVREFITPLKKIAIHTKRLAYPLYIECFGSCLKEAI